MAGIDTHSHWVAPSYVERVRGYADIDPGFARLNAGLLAMLEVPDAPIGKIEPRIEEMDACGLDVSVLSYPPPAAAFGDRGLRRTIASEANDELLAACSRFPSRLAALVTLPLPHVEDALDELDRVADHPLARGVGALTTAAEFACDNPELEPVWRRTAELGFPVQAHPVVDCLTAAAEPWRLPSTLAPVMASSLGVARMVLSGMLDRLPDLEVIVPHLGGTLPYLAQRFDDFGSGEAAHPFSHYLRHRLYLDTCSFHPPALRCAIETVGAERLVLGSDYPARGSLQRLVDDIEHNIPDEKDRARIMHETATRWFG